MYGFIKNISTSIISCTESFIIIINYTLISSKVKNFLLFVIWITSYFELIYALKIFKVIICYLHFQFCIEE